MRSELPKWVDYGLLPLINLAVAFLIAGLVVIFVGENPLRAAYLLVDGCGCARGCPACVGAPQGAGMWCKGDVVWWLGRMAPRGAARPKAAKER